MTPTVPFFRAMPMSPPGAMTALERYTSAAVVFKPGA
jgi:hypothetical protein